jgi:micrococcal nuclease
VIVFAAGCGPQSAVDPPESTPSGEVLAAAAETRAPRQDAVTGRIVDGDTFVVFLQPSGTEVRVRPYGIDAPERGDCGYRAAAAYVAEQLPPGHPVQLVREPGQPNRDRYDRLLRYVRYLLPGAVDGQVQDLSQNVARAGWAVHYDDYPVGTSGLIEAAEQDARAAGRGQWAPSSAGGCAA